jgi:hypothetical protein
MYWRCISLHATYTVCYAYEAMTSPEREYSLPRVEEDDLLNLVFEDITDPVHKERWQAFASSNPALTREVLKRAYVAARGNMELQKIILDAIAYAYAALAAAAIRLSAQEAPPAVTVGYDDDEGRQPSV